MSRTETTPGAWALFATAGWRRGLRLGVGLAALVLGAAACSSSSSGTTTTTTQSSSTSSGGTSPSSSSSSAPSSTSGSSSSSLSQFASKITGGQGATYVATYSLNSSTSGASETGTLTIAHSGSSSLFGVTTKKGTTNASFEEIITAGKTTICAKTAATWTCFGGALSTELGTSLDPFLHLYSAKSQITTLKAEEAGAYDITSSSKNVGGQSVNCITFHTHTNPGVYTVCVTSQGVLAEVDGQNSSGHWTLTLTSLSTSVPSTEFTPPAAVTNP